MDILEWLRKIKISFTLDEALIIMIIIFVIFGFIQLICKTVKSKLKFKIKVRTITISGVSVDLECNNDVKKIANGVWIELSTRKIALPFDEENDVIVEVYDSWYKVFEKFREILKSLNTSKNKDVEKLINIILKTLNEELREHLTKWQARFRKWYESNKLNDGDPQEIQKQYPHYKELVGDLKKVNNNMIELTQELDKIRRGE